MLLGGDGRLWLWDIFNRIKFGVVEETVQYAGRSLSAGDGANYVQSPEQVHPFEQGFLLKVRARLKRGIPSPRQDRVEGFFFGGGVSDRVRLVSRSCLRRGFGLGILFPLCSPGIGGVGAALRGSTIRDPKPKR